MRPLPLMAAGLLAATLLASPMAYAAGETCQGRPATIVGTPSQFDLTGTEGDDVVVTGGASGVSTLGGNDLVCVTGPTASSQMTLITGAGDDVVDASTATSGVAVSLGSGRDTYTGSTGFDSVETGPDGETDQDTVLMGAGSPWSGVVSGTRGSDLPNPDVVVLGANGGSVSWFGPMAPGARLDGGGSGRLSTYLTGRAVVLDAGARTLVQDGATTLAWTGFDGFGVRDDTGAPESFTFVGTERDEQLTVELADAHATRQRIDLAGGDDTLLLGDSSNIGASGSAYAGGPGADHASLWAGNRLDLDLASGRMETRRSGRTVRTRFTGFETQLLGAKKLDLKGTKNADVMRFYACQVTVRGRGGADDVAQSRGDDYFEAGLRCNPRRFRLYGDGGNDVLRGSTDNDLLVGGKGRDTLNGNGGRDTCSGEKLRSCEIKRR